MSDYSTYLETEYQNDLKYARQFIFSFGSNYSLGVKLFPKDIREQTIFFYAFVRYADEIVDNPNLKMDGQTHNTIKEFISEWRETIKNGPHSKTHQLLRANYWVFKNKDIPFEYSFDFLDVMQQDTSKDRYDSYAELEHYMWGSASVVGHVMTFIVGYKDAKAFDPAKSLGEAMQMANILRDVKEDLDTRNRIYLPLRGLATFGVDSDMITESTSMTPQLTNAIKYYYEHTERLFTKGINGIHYLNHGGFSVLLASRIYRQNIRILKKRNYDIFAPKITISKCIKILMLISNFFVYPYLLIKTNRID